MTVIKAFAARMNSTTVSITVSRRNQLLVHINNEEVTFVSDDDDTSSQSDTITLRLPNVSITKNITNDQITLLWMIGVSIKITPVFLNTTSTLVINVAAAVSGNLKGNWTFGLIGSYDGNTQNDFRIKNGTVIGTIDNLSPQKIHEVSFCSNDQFTKSSVYFFSSSVSLGLFLPIVLCSTMKQMRMLHSMKLKI